jgi:predicted RNA binding protein with dsRBD fold (UPF0201 family)
MTHERLDALVSGSIEADLMPTEDSQKLILAIQKIFPNADLKKKGENLIGETSLSLFRELIEKQKIRDAVEGVLDSNLREGKSFMDLNKLAALTGKVALDAESPNGKIRLYLHWKA